MARKNLHIVLLLLIAVGLGSIQDTYLPSLIAASAAAIIMCLLVEQSFGKTAGFSAGVVMVVINNALCEVDFLVVDTYFITVLLSVLLVVFKKTEGRKQLLLVCFALVCFGIIGEVLIHNRAIAGNVDVQIQKLMIALLPLVSIGVLTLLIMGRTKLTTRKTYVTNLLIWAVWSVPVLFHFIISGYFNPYDLLLLAPAAAALSGAGMVEMWRAYMQSGWRWLLLPGAIILTSVIQILLPGSNNILTITKMSVAVISILSSVSLIIIRLLRREELRNTIKTASIIGFSALLIIPAFAL